MIGQDDVVVVTGATGFTGVHLVRELCRTGAEVRVIVRESSRREALADLPIRWFVGEVYDEDVIAAAMEGANYLFHVAAAFREAKVGDEVYTRVHVDSTKLLAKHASLQGDFRRFVHTSTMGVHGHVDEPPANEEYRFAPGDLYQSTKVEAELWIREYGREHGLPVTVVRPCAIYGPGDRRLLKLFKMAKLPVVPILGIGQQGLYHLVHVEDLVGFMIVAATHERTLGEVYLCGNERAIPIADIIRTIARKLDRKPRFVRVPVTPFFLAGDLCEAICKPLGVEPPIYRRRVAFFTKDRSFDTSKLREHTGFTFRHGNEDGLEALCDWYREQGWL